MEEIVEAVYLAAVHLRPGLLGHRSKELQTSENAPVPVTRAHCQRLGDVVFPGDTFSGYVTCLGLANQLPVAHMGKAANHRLVRPNVQL